MASDRKNLFKSTALAVTIAAAAASLTFMFMVGRQQKSALLILLFTVWVVSPFIAIIGGQVIAKRWSAFRRDAFVALALVLSVGSVALYANVVLGPPRPQPASFFLIVPAASWVLIGVVLFITSFVGRKN